MSRGSMMNVVCMLGSGSWAGAIPLSRRTTYRTPGEARTAIASKTAAIRIDAAAIRD